MPMIQTFLLSRLGLLNFFILVFLLSLSRIAGADSLSTVNIPRISQSISIDGRLNDPGWKEAVIIKDFYTHRPIDGLPAKEKTAVLLGYTPASLYVAFVCYDPQPELIRATISRRDFIDDDDNIVIYLDTFNSGKETYYFSFNPYGIQADGIYIDMVAVNANPDYIFYSKGRKFKQGYIVEAEIPFKSLRFPDTDDNMVWGICVARTIKHLDKDIIWPKISQNSTTFIPQFAKLKGLYGIGAGSNVEILPEVTASKNEEYDFDIPEYVKEHWKGQLGINLKLGFLSNLTMDLAYNPDFSQVEADADRIDVNRRFPLYYDEKRPFFLEGTNIFQTPINAVYTRRIVDPLLGVKLSANFSGYELGLLGGIDEYYGSEDYLDNIATEHAAEDTAFNRDDFFKQYGGKKSYHTVVRLRKDIYSYSKIGFLVTDKRFEETYSSTYGLDGDVLIADEFSLTFQGLYSQTKDFFDSEKRGDPAFYLNLFRGSRTFNFNLFYTDIFPDFEIQNGFLARDPDYREIGGQFYFDFLFDDSFIQLIRPVLYLTRMFNHNPEDKIKSGRKIESYIGPAVTISTRGQNNLGLYYYRQFEDYLGVGFDKNQYMIDFNSHTLSWLYATVNIFWGDGIYYSYDPFLGKTRTISWGVELKPIINWATLFSGNHYTFNGENENVDTRIIQDILRLRSVFQFTREISLRVILETNNYYKDLDVNILGGWHPSPGTVIFLGYNDYFSKEHDILDYIQAKENTYARLARGFFFKFSYLIRL